MIKNIGFCNDSFMIVYLLWLIFVGLAGEIEANEEYVEYRID